MQKVIVNNNTGIVFHILSNRIKPIREFVGDQTFSFQTCASALAFEKAVNENKEKRLTALYSPSKEDLELEGIEYRVEGESEPKKQIDTVNSGDELKAKRDAYVKKLIDDNSKPDLVMMAEEMKLEDYQNLNKEPLAKLIAANTKL